MARRPTRISITRRLHQLLDQFEPQVRDAFLAGAQQIVDDVLLREFVDLIARGEIDAAIRALNIEPAAFRALDVALVSAYGAGGAITADNLPAMRDRSGARVIIRFDQRNLRAEQWARTHVGGLIRGIVADQVTGVREAIVAGLEAGRSPLNTALNIVGRVDRTSGRRVGGIIGVTASHARTVENARLALLAGDLEGMRHYLGLKRRDARFDRTVLAAIREGRPVPSDMVTRITGRLSDGYLQVRGEVIARTETLRSVNTARHEAFRQGLERTGYTDADVERVWDSTGDSKVRHTHRAMDGQTVKGIDTPFVSPSGAMLLHPGDPNAPIEETAQCRCIERIRINYFGGTANG